MTRIDLDDGKYSIIHYHGVGLRVLRYGEPWRDCSGDGLILALAQEVEVLREQQAVLVDRLLGASNYIDRLGGNSADFRQTLAAVKFIG